VALWEYPAATDMAEDKPTPTPAEQAQKLYEDAEAQTAKAMEDLVNQDSFGELLAKVAGNVVAVMKIGGDVADLVVGNLRVAGRRDVLSLHRQLARTEDKLELVLQEVERLRDAVEAGARDGAPPAKAANGARTRTRNGRRRAGPGS
jgi:hypothetical protein